MILQLAFDLAACVWESVADPHFGRILWRAVRG